MAIGLLALVITGPFILHYRKIILLEQFGTRETDYRDKEECEDLNLASSWWAI